MPLIMLYMNQQWPVTLPVTLYMYSCCVLSSHWHGVDDVNVTLCRLNRHWTLLRTESTPLRLCLSHSTFLVFTLQYRSVNALDIDNSSMRLQGMCSHKLLYTYTQCLTQGWVHDVEICCNYYDKGHYQYVKDHSHNICYSCLSILWLCGFH